MSTKANIQNQIEKFREGTKSLEDFRKDLRAELSERESDLNDFKTRLKLPGKTATETVDHAANAVEYGAWLQTAVKASKGDAAAQAKLADWHTHEKATMIVGDDSLGGYSVPQEVETTLTRMFEEGGVMEQRMRSVNMNRSEYRIPIEASRPAATFHTESDSIAATSTTFDVLDMKAYRQDAYVDASKELLADSTMDMLNVLFEQMTDAVASGFDSAVFSGDGSTSAAGFSGIFTANAGASMDISGAAMSTIVVSDLIDLYHMVPARLRQRGGIFVMHPDVSKHLKLETSGSDGEYMLNPYSAQNTISVHGIPIVESTDAPNTDSTGEPVVSFVSTRHLIMGRRSGLEVLVDPYTQAGSWTTRVYFVRRLAIGLTDTDAVARALIGT